MFRARDVLLLLGVGLAAALGGQACGSKGGSFANGDSGVFVAIDGAAPDGTTGEGGSSGGADAACIVCNDGGGSSSGATASPIPATCADSLSRNSYIGCDYWPSVTLNPVWPMFDFAVAVSNPQTSSVTVTVSGGA